MFKRALYQRLEKLAVHSIGPSMRQWGQSILATGQAHTGDNQHREELVKSLRSVPLNDRIFPKVLTADWVAPNATVIGDVHADVGSSIWHATLLRGDTGKITIGKNSIVQDRALLKSSEKGNGNIEIGENCFVGANVQLDSCTLHDFAYVGMGATIHKGAVIESHAVVAAGAVVPAGATVPSNQVWAGNPAKYLRDVTQEEKHQISEYLVEMQQMSQIY
jgi:carbonic anhydrase/acetyltransferase-like protein (isoleucine patch superfamily)